jgi:predicted phosphate transport protein (TIGR00153 family)
MQEHMRASVGCAHKLLELLDAMVAGDRAAVARIRKEIDELEHEADRIKNEIRSHLPRRLLMAMERRDMLEILDFQDSIADTTQDIAGLADQRGMGIPEALREPILELARRSLAACDEARGVIDELDDLVEVGFKGREVGRVETMIGSLGRIESETDELAERATRKLFALESEIGIGVVFWYQMIAWIGDLADHAEKVGNRLRLLIAT